MKKKIIKAKKSAPPKKPKFNAMSHWKGMPEFDQKEAGPIKQVLVGFANKEDMLRFSKLVGQQITAKTPSIWFPAVATDGAINKRYTDK